MSSFVAPSFRSFCTTASRGTPILSMREYFSNDSVVIAGPATGTGAEVGAGAVAIEAF